MSLLSRYLIHHVRFVFFNLSKSNMFDITAIEWYVLLEFRDTYCWSRNTDLRKMDVTQTSSISASLVHVVGCVSLFHWVMFAVTQVPFDCVGLLFNIHIRAFCLNKLNWNWCLLCLQGKLNKIHWLVKIQDEAGWMILREDGKERIGENVRRVWNMTQLVFVSSWLFPSDFHRELDFWRWSMLKQCSWTGTCGAVSDCLLQQVDIDADVFFVDMDRETNHTTGGSRIAHCQSEDAPLRFIL